MTSELLVVGVSLLVGWAALLPLLGLVPPVVFHACALPTGFVAWGLAASVSNLTRLPLWLGVAIALPGFVVACHLYLRSVGARDIRLGAKDVVGFLVTGVSVLAVAAAAVSIGYTVITDDGWRFYAVGGTRIWADSSFSPQLMGERNVFLPSLMAAQRVFGGEWLLAPFPLIALETVAAVMLLVSFSPWRVPRWRGLAFGAGAALVMASTGPFLLHAIYVHTNLASAMYLTMAVMLILYAREAPQVPDGSSPGRTALLFAAGLMLAGLALARQDGVAYALVPLALFANDWLSSDGNPKDPGALVLPLLLILGTVYVSAFATVGLWENVKFSGKMAVVALLAVYAALELLERTRQSRWLHRALYVASRFRVFIAIGALVWTLQYVRNPDETKNFTAGILSNLTMNSGWGWTWYALAATWLIGLAYAARVRYSQRTAAVAFAFLGSVIMAFVLPHSGHEPTWADSMNRLMLHFVPLGFALSGLVASGLWRSAMGDVSETP